MPKFSVFKTECLVHADGRLEVIVRDFDEYETVTCWALNGGHTEFKLKLPKPEGVKP